MIKTAKNVQKKPKNALSVSKVLFWKIISAFLDALRGFFKILKVVFVENVSFLVRNVRKINA